MLPPGTAFVFVILLLEFSRRYANELDPPAVEYMDYLLL